MEKTKELMKYIVSVFASPTITTILKVCYLIDLVFVKRHDRQITDFEYRRYNFGPYDTRIYQLRDALILDGVLDTTLEYTMYGAETVKFSLSQGAKPNLDIFSEEELEVIEESFSKLSSYGAKVLTEIAYETKPLKSLGATIGGKEHMNEKLNLRA